MHAGILVSFPYAIEVEAFEYWASVSPLCPQHPVLCLVHSNCSRFCWIKLHPIVTSPSSKLSIYHPPTGNLTIVCEHTDLGWLLIKSDYFILHKFYLPTQTVSSLKWTISFTYLHFQILCIEKEFKVCLLICYYFLLIRNTFITNLNKGEMETWTWRKEKYNLFLLSIVNHANLTKKWPNS